MANNIYAWSTTPASNAAVDGIDWAEGMSPGNVNSSARQQMASTKAFVADLAGGLVAGGSANAITLTANAGFATLTGGLVVSFKASADNTGATTLSVNALGAKSVRKMSANGDAALEGREIQEGGIYTVKYSTDANGSSGGWILDNPTLPTLTLWAPYTPTFAGFGTVSNVAVYWRRVGDTCEIKGRFTSGTPTAAPATMTMPDGILSLNNGTLLGGTGVYSVASPQFFTILQNSNNNLLSFGVQSATLPGSSGANGSSITSSGNVMTFNAAVQISGW